MSRKVSRILLLGSYGQDNLGDEAMLSMMISWLKKYDENLIVNSSDPILTKQTFGVRAIDTNKYSDIFTKLWAFIRADAIVFGGGTLLIEHKDINGKYLKRPIYQTFTILLLSKILHKKTCLFAIGVEAIETKLSRIISGWSLKLSGLVIVRDSASLDLAHQLGAKRNIYQGVDMIYCYPKPIRKEKTTTRILIGIAPSYWMRGGREEREEFILKQTEILKKLSLNNKFEILLLPFKNGYGENDDMWFCERIVKSIGPAKNVQIVDTQSVDKMMEIISTLDIMVGVRLHASVFSVLYGIPTIPINYQPRVGSIFKDAGFEKYMIDPGELTFDEVNAMVREILKDNSSVKKFVSSKAKTNYKKAKEMFEIADGYLSR